MARHSVLAGTRAAGRSSRPDRKLQLADFAVFQIEDACDRLLLEIILQVAPGADFLAAGATPHERILVCELRNFEPDGAAGGALKFVVQELTPHHRYPRQAMASALSNNGILKRSRAGNRAFRKVGSQVAGDTAAVFQPRRPGHVGVQSATADDKLPHDAWRGKRRMSLHMSEDASGADRWDSGRFNLPLVRGWRRLAYRSGRRRSGRARRERHGSQMPIGSAMSLLQRPSA